MNWEDEGYLLSKRKFRENANIVNVFTQSRGRMSGIVYGGNSRKIRNYLQLSNKLFVVHSSKNENKSGYFKTELIKPISPFYFNDKIRISALISLCSTLNFLLPEEQPNKKIYKSLEEFLNSIDLENWIILFIFLELTIIKELGFDPNLTKFKNSQLNLNDTKKINIDNTNYQVPNFLIEKKIPDNLTNPLIKQGLYFTRSIIQNKFFLTNNLPFPKTRILLENYFS